MMKGIKNNMAKGQESKEKIIETLLSTFPNSFLNNGGKEVRIPMIEAGEPLEIKVTLTAAKDIIGNGSNNNSSIPNAFDWSDKPSTPTELSKEDKDKVDKLFNILFQD